MKYAIKCFFLILLISVFYIEGYANMSSPIVRGSNISEPYSSKDIDIVKESIQITAINLHQAKFVVMYTINSDRTGKQIPFVFHTMTNNYGENGEFKAWVDDQPLEISEIPSSYNNSRALQWIDSLDNHLRYSQSEVPDIIGLKYFEANLSKGIHTIRVEYIAEATVNLHNPVKQLSYNYNLRPARYWRSFGTLDVEVDLSALSLSSLHNSLSQSDSLETTLVSHWHFTELPQDEFSIEYIPKVSKLANVFILITPQGLSLVCLLVLIMIHVYMIYRFRLRYLKKRFSPVVIIGSILVPLFYCFIFIYAFDIVDSIIGQDNTSQRHGYTFFIFFTYPIFMPLYWIFMWMSDKLIKSKLSAKNTVL